MKKNILCLSLIFFGSLFSSEDKTSKFYYICNAKIIEVTKCENSEFIEYSATLENTNEIKAQFVICRKNLHAFKFECIRWFRTGSLFYNEILDENTYALLESIYELNNNNNLIEYQEI